MSRDWKRYLANAQTDAGRAIVEQGKRIQEARQKLPERRYLHVLAKAGITPRDARLLAAIGSRLHSVLESQPSVRLPYRIRTLSSLAELSAETLAGAANDGLLHPAMTEVEARELRGTTSEPFPSVIRPTDNWNFATLRWPRIDGWDGHGYIPGDLYANCLWYYAREGDTVVDPMAGSGMMLKVWEDRDQWYETDTVDIQITLSDLVPRGPYANQIRERDLLDPEPTEYADYIIIDPPYCGLVNGQYSDSPSDLANMDTDSWVKAMATIAKRFSSEQPDDGRCTVIVPNSRSVTTGETYTVPGSHPSHFPRGRIPALRRHIRFPKDATETRAPHGDTQQPSSTQESSYGRHRRSADIYQQGGLPLWRNVPLAGPETKNH